MRVQNNKNDTRAQFCCRLRKVIELSAEEKEMFFECLRLEQKEKNSLAKCIRKLTNRWYRRGRIIEVKMVCQYKESHRLKDSFEPRKVFSVIFILTVELLYTNQDWNTLYSLETLPPQHRAQPSFIVYPFLLIGTLSFFLEKVSRDVAHINSALNIRRTTRDAACDIASCVPISNVSDISIL